MRLLHEVGHIVRKHPGDPTMRSMSHGLVFAHGQDKWKEALTGFEGEAWRFALNFRKDEKPLFFQLVDDFREWTKTHEFEDIDWDFDAAKMYKRITKKSLRRATIKIPLWLKVDYSEFIPGKTIYKIQTRI